MSEIPFVNRLGDAIDDAIAEPQPAKRRRRRRRLGGLALAVFLLGAGGVTIAEILDDPETLATGQVACYSEASFEPDVASVQSGGGREPTALCAELLRTNEPLVACVRKEGFVTVFPGPPETCERLGLKPLPAGYDAARRKVARLRADVARLLRAADCVPPATLARRAQRVLDRSGWDGWRAEVTGGRGPCGWVAVSDGLRGRTLPIRRRAPRSLERLLEARYERLLALSGRRCFTVRSLRRRVRRELAPANRPIAFRLDVGPLPRWTDLDPLARNRRFEQGCAVFEGVSPAYPRPRRIVVVAEIRLKRR
jgi:hypothetical protein